MKPSPRPADTPFSNYLNEHLSFTLISEAEQGLAVYGNIDDVELDYDSVEHVGRSLRLIVTVDARKEFSDLVFYVEDEPETIINKIGHALLNELMPTDPLTIHNILTRLQHHMF